MENGPDAQHPVIRTLYDHIDVSFVVFLIDICIFIKHAAKRFIIFSCWYYALWIMSGWSSVFLLFLSRNRLSKFLEVYVLERSDVGLAYFSKNVFF